MLSDRDYTRAPFRSRPAEHTSIIKLLIIANAVIFVLQMLSGRLNPILSLDFGSLTRKLEIWRLGTHMFAHGNIGHIFFNMWALYIFGQPLEREIGGNRFLNLYLLSGIVGAVTWLAFNASPILQLPNGEALYPTVIGASGAVFGIMVAAAILFPNRMYMMLIPPIPMRLKTLALVFGIIESLSLLRQGGGRIAHLAHLGGMLGGYLYMRWAFPSLWSRGFGSVFRSWFVGKRDPTNRGFRRVDPESSDVPSAEIDRILDKIGEHGISSLTAKEKSTLEHARQRFKRH